MPQAPVIDLRALRINRGLSVAEAADKIGISRDALARAESGEGIPQPRNALKIAKFYGHLPTDVWPLAPSADVDTPDEKEAA